MLTYVSMTAHIGHVRQRGLTGIKGNRADPDDCAAIDFDERRHPCPA